jgi:hypothetical protein
MTLFDATITLGPQHLADAGLDPLTQSNAVADAIRAAVEAIPGAKRIDVAVDDFLPSISPWVNVWAAGTARTPHTPEWQQLREAVEGAIRNGLVAVSASA